MAIAGCIDEGASVADIGTDHGFLPVYLAQTGRARKIIASDLSLGSLSSARHSASRYGVTEAVEFRQADGLDGICENDVDTVVIAGVGGETILDMLSRAPWTVGAARNGRLKLILQAQTKLDVLRDFLRDMGYNISSEQAVVDRGREYVIIVV